MLEQAVRMQDLYKQRMAKEWGEQIRHYQGRAGGWIYSPKGTPIAQGWMYIWRTYHREILDWYTRRLTGFDTFRDMLNAERGYYPTMLYNALNPREWRTEALADAYDEAQARRGDSRRAYRGILAQKAG